MEAFFWIILLMRLLNMVTFGTSRNSSDSGNNESVTEESRIETALNDHMHPHPPLQKYLQLKTVIRFTYGDNDPLGPLNWDTVPSAEFTTNECAVNKFTPFNINTSLAGLAESDTRFYTSSNREETTSLTFIPNPELDSAGWDFGFPDDIFNGIGVFPKSFGLLQIMDEYDSHMKNGGTPSRMYDFTFALVTFCDFNKSSKNRSGHRIDGKKYPLEIHLMFFGFSTEFGIDKTVSGSNKDDLVMVSILGEISEEDNPKLTPMISAAKNFNGSNFDSNIEYEPIEIIGSFSPVAFLPNESGYYYYQGNFPIPPCFTIPRIYILKVPITISQKQLSVLTNIKSKREPSGVLTCTFGLIEEELIIKDDLLYNPSSIKFQKFSEDELINQGEKNQKFNPDFTFLNLFIIIFLLQFQLK